MHARVEVLFDKIQEKEPTQDFPPERNDRNFDEYICSLEKIACRIRGISDRPGREWEKGRKGL